MEPASAPLPRLNEKASKSKTKTKEVKSEPTQRKCKTFNRLDQRFQLTSEHDDEHIFPEEHEMIKQLRAKFPGLKNFTDKSIVCFLCARRHDMEKVETLISRNLKLREELGIDKDKPITSDDGWKLLKQGHVFFWSGCVDKHGRIIQYCKLAKDDPKSTSVEEKMRFLFWEAEYFEKNWSLKYLRNGLVMIVDMQGFSWHNLDWQHGREVTEAMTGVFWRRIRTMVAINGGFMLRAAVKAAKMVMSKKMMKRIDIKDDLSELIDNPNLLLEYGGKLEITLDDVHKRVVFTDDQ